MSPLKTIAYRLPQELIDRIDAYAKMRTRVDRRPCDRSTAIRVLLEKALDMETSGKSETVHGKVTDDFILDCSPDVDYSKPPAPKKKPHRPIHRVPGVPFEQAMDRLDPKKKR